MGESQQTDQRFLTWTRKSQFHRGPLVVNNLREVLTVPELGPNAAFDEFGETIRFRQVLQVDRLLGGPKGIQFGAQLLAQQLASHGKVHENRRYSIRAVKRAIRGHQRV